MPEAVTARTATPLPTTHWAGRVTIVSPHLDDAVLSLGASMRAASRRGTQVDVLTVLSGDPASETPSDKHNRRAGFETAGAAARARQLEDERACRMVGSRAMWLPLADDANEAPLSDEEIAVPLAKRLEGYDAVLVPGFPLHHRDHKRVSRLALAALAPGTIVGLYVEQPYASWRALSRKRLKRSPMEPMHVALEAAGLRLTAGGLWRRTSCAPSDWVAKVRAAGAYRSQIAVLRRAPRTRILAYELLRGGERVLWCRLDRA